MKLQELIEQMQLEVRGTTAGSNAEVSGGYASDLLSDVLANCQDGNLWITLQIHPNIVAVASMKNVSAIILINGREPTEETIERANEEGVPLLTTSLSAFTLIGRLYELGLRGTAEDANGA